MRSFLGLIGAVLVVVAGPALAADPQGAWTLAEKSGDVRVVHPGLQPASVQVRSALVPGDIVTTGVTGRAMLTRGKDYVVVAPGSRLLLPPEQQESGFTRLVQQVGTMLYKVHHTGVPHFAVQTPMLAAVVKGTSFTVIVEKDRAAVQVTDGVVEVSSAVGQARRLVERGVTVYVGREQPGAIIEMKPGTMSPPDPAKTSGVKITRSGDVPLSTIASLTGGLVNAAPAVSAVGASEPQSAAGAASQNGPSSVQPAVEHALQVAFNDPAHSSSDRTPGLTQPVFNIVQAAAPGIAGSDALGSAPAATEPVIDIVQTAVPAVTQPVVGVVQAVVPAVSQPVAGIVQTAVPAVTQPVAVIVQTVVPAVTQPVTGIVQTVVPAVTQPVAGIVQTAVPAVTQPVVDVVQTVVPAVTQPVVNVVQTTVPILQPVINTVTQTIPAVTQPVGSLLGGLGSLLGH